MLLQTSNINISLQFFTTIVNTLQLYRLNLPPTLGAIIPTNVLKDDDGFPILDDNGGYIYIE